MNESIPMVVVEKLPFGFSHFMLAVVDEFTPGELTVTTSETDRVMATFRKGTWLTAIQYDSHGYPLCTFTSKEGQQREADAAAKVRELARRTA